MRYLFGLSFVLNLLLITTIVAARVDPSRSVVAIGGAGELPVAGFDPGDDPVRALRQSAFSLDDIKAMTLGWLERRFAEDHVLEPGDYWQPGYSPRRAALVRRIAIEAAVRGELVALFGPDAADDPAFARVFRPLGPAYAFLSSQAQIELERHQLELIENGMAAAGAPPPRLAACLAPGGTSPPEAPAGLPAGLTPAETAAYRLRFSATAEQLRRHWEAPGEAVYREVFTRLEQLAGASSPASQAGIRADLRELMGDAAFDRFWSTRDPFHATIEEYLKSHGLADSRVSAAYAVVNRAQETLLASLGSDADSEAMLLRIARAKKAENDRLERLLGEDIAAGLQAAMSRAAMALGASSAGC